MYTQHKLILQSQLYTQLTSHFCSEGIHSVLWVLWEYSMGFKSVN